ncbi:MAG: radical SAM protein [Theionarchaea archaeon]|nr:MAG: hypothetical protein AYK18_08985 [Theionarchaea archaeon DG-70]MBU7010934.1 radical SAM protein [Theionarchaea archaeon]
MLLSNFRQEEFGYTVVGSRGEMAIVTPEAKNHLRIGKSLDIDKYKPRRLRISLPFHLKAPLVTMVEVTKKCNLRCGHCYLDAGEPRENEMDTEGIYRVLDELKEIKAFHILITGGEPFVRSDIVDIINYAQKCGFFVQIITNGTLLSDTLLSQIEDRGRVSFAITYLGGLQAGFSNDEAFTLLKKKIALIRSHEFPVMCWYCVTKLNLDKKLEIHQWCVDNNVDTNHQDVMPIGRCRGNIALLLDINDIEKNLEEAEEDDERDYRSAFDMCYILEHSARVCKGGRTFAYICSNGDVYPCSNCAAEKLFLAGNLNESPFLDLWEDSFKDIRGITWDDFKGCKTCELHLNPAPGQFCKLRCPPFSKILYGDPLYCGATEYAKAISTRRFYEV